MTEIRPTIRCFPSTTETLADSNLPFSCVLTPLYEGRSSSQKTDYKALPALSSVPKCIHCGAPHPTRDTHFAPGGTRGSASSSSFLVCYLCGKKTVTDKLPPAVKGRHHSKHKQQQQQPQPSQIFQIPLFATPSLSIKSLPVLSCPPVCWFLLDGSCPHRSYWTTMSRLLKQIVDDMPPFVHLGIVVAATVPSATSKTVLDNANDNGIATTTVFSYVDLTSPVPHMLHSYHYHHDHGDDSDDDDSDGDSSDDDDRPRGAARVPATSGKSGGTGGLLDHLQLVPADSLHMPNIQAAIRSFVDYDPTQHQLTHQQHAYTMSMPLGRTIETVLDFMDRATHPGAPDEEAQEGSTLWRMKKASQTPVTKPPPDAVYYAGGKIMSFLATCPTDLRGDDWRPLTRKALPHRSTVGVGGFGGAVRNGSIPPAATAPVHHENVTEKKAEAIAARDATAAANDVESGFFGSRFKNLTGFSGFATSDEEESDDEAEDDDDDDEEPKTKKGNDNKLDQDMTPESLLDYYRPAEDAEKYYQELGSQCAEAALGVDIFVLVQQPDTADDEGFATATIDDSAAEVDVGLPFLRGLADRSGAPGPLIFGLPHGFVSPNSQNPDLERLEREALARVPWGGFEEVDTNEGGASQRRHRRPVAFGGELRLRLSPSFDVDRSPVDPVEEGPQLAMLYSSNGIMGPATAEEESHNLWRLGTCDPFTALTIDLDMTSKVVKDKLNVEGFGEINWKPVIQSCFAYTIVVPDPDNPGQYRTVRQMRMAHIRVPLTDSVETLFNSVDPETVAVVLFHKITLTLLRDGLTSAQEIGEDWLRSLLVCAYQSAEDEEEEQRERAGKGYMHDDAGRSNGESSSSLKLAFYANERLLDREGDLSAEEVLLAQGHELLKSLPLIVYSLLQCDAIRISSPASYIPTLDARCAAGAQMSAMTPSVLSKCIAPRLQLWSCQEGLVMDMLDLKADAIRLSVQEFGNNPKTGSPRDDLVLFLDAPDSIVICDAGRFHSPSGRSKQRLSIGPALQRAIDTAMHSYRTPPTLICDLDDVDSAIATQGYRRVLEVLVEDAPMSKEVPNFKAWGEELASEVHDELDKDDD